MPENFNINSKIVNALKGSPAYQLVFGVVIVFIPSSFILKNGITNEDYILAILIVVMFLIACVTLIAVVYRVEHKTAANKEITEPISNLQHKEINEALNAIFSNIKNGIEKENTFLNERILDITFKWRTISGNWKDGMFVANSEEYNNVLLSVYTRAKQEIFSTSTEQYNSTWNRELGRSIVKAHENGTANVTRVFLFGKRSEITKEHIDKMKFHNDCDKVSVRVFIDDEAPFNFPPEIAKDFTIIDNGTMIGVTQRFDPEDLSATWYCDNANRIDTFNRVRNDLMKDSKPFNEIMDWWKTKNKT